ncbi:hypothetical protein IG193_00835 [Infirmifilum lucidum]|uniref:Uncharacterized protein n=1 Tax=Infirmifilum lucidum TaxID=2776706 RepID=A0A7L9FJE2_9CREN|nr:hypothetical protein [Infirmifilum lucidum]QOJ79044.1 hypothetical protein IG193_00835 [Infirmifilum lucidum]
MSRVQLEYPSSRRAVVLEASLSAGTTLTTIFLASRSPSHVLEFSGAFITSFLALFTTLTVWKILKTEKALAIIFSKGEYEELRRGGLQEFLRGLAVVYAALALFVVLPPVVALGLVMGALTAKGFADSIHYLYVRRLEKAHGTRMVAYIESTDREGWYKLCISTA